MKYRMIVEDMKKEIENGNIEPSGRILSIRELCDRYKCTKSTAQRAYSEMREAGIIYAVPGSGYYLINAIKSKDKANTVIDFSGTSIDKNSLPYSEFQPCVNQAINKYKENLFTYSDPQGLNSLIEALRRHLQQHQVFASNERIFVTTGSQQALNLLTKMHFPNGKSNVAIEQPTYQGIIQCLKMNNITAIGVTRGFEGLDFNSLEKTLKNDNIKFFYTIPRFSNPLGLSYSNEDKKRILALAEKYNVYIVEDDYLGDLESDAKSTPIFSFDQSDRVIYVKTFSKVLLPGLRVATVVLPKLLINTFREYKYWSDLNTPLISQGALEIYLTSGMFNIHVGKIREMYLNRMSCLKSIAQTHSNSTIQWHIPQKGGFYAGLRIQNGSRGTAVVEGLSKKNILLSDTKNYYLQEFFNDKILRLSIANTEAEAMTSGVLEVINEVGEKACYYERGINL